MEEDKVKLDLSPLVDAIISIGEDYSKALDKIKTNEPLSIYDYFLLDWRYMFSFSIKRLLKNVKEKNMEKNIDFNFYISIDEAKLIIAGLETLSDMYHDIESDINFDEEIYDIVNDKKEIIDNMISTFSQYIEEEG